MTFILHKMTLVFETIIGRKSGGKVVGSIIFMNTTISRATEFQKWKEERTRQYVKTGSLKK